MIEDLFASADINNWKIAVQILRGDVNHNRNGNQKILVSNILKHIFNNGLLKAVRNKTIANNHPLSGYIINYGIIQFIGIDWFSYRISIIGMPYFINGKNEETAQHQLRTYIRKHLL